LQQTIIKLKQRIDKNYETIQEKYLFTQILLEKINILLNKNASNKEIHKWLEKNDNVIFVLEYYLKQIEKKNDFKR